MEELFLNFRQEKNNAGIAFYIINLNTSMIREPTRNRKRKNLFEPTL